VNQTTAMKAALEMAGYVLELTNDISENQYIDEVHVMD